MNKLGFQDGYKYNPVNTLLAMAAGGIVGPAIGYAVTKDKAKEETDKEYRKRVLKNMLTGLVTGVHVPAIAGTLIGRHLNKNK